MFDNGRAIDWGKSSLDYSQYRPGPPNSFYEKLLALGISRAGQALLDLGTGTGALARHFAKQGAEVAGVDIAEQQIAAAINLAQRENLIIDFRVSSAETTPFADHRFDVITANQCWLYFDLDKAIKEVKRLLRPNGVLVISSLLWLPLQCPIAQASEQLILQYNPHWDAHSWDGKLEADLPWFAEHFNLQHWLCYEEIPFTREQWRGRIRASRGIAPTLTKAEVEQFDQEHEQLLQKIAGNEFTIAHQIFARVLAPK